MEGEIQGSAAQAQAAPPEANRRTDFRLATDKSIEIHVAGVRYFVSATLVDISATGCQFSSPTKINPGAAIRFDLPHEGHPTLKLVGTIKSTRLNKKENIFRSGVRFEYEKEADKDALYRFIVEQQRHVIGSVRALAQKRRMDMRWRLFGFRRKKIKARVDFRIRYRFAIQYMLGDGHKQKKKGFAVDIGAGGMRVAAESVLNKEFPIFVHFTLPKEVLDVFAGPTSGADPARVARLRPFKPITVGAKILPGVKESHGLFLHSVEFIDPKGPMIEEIERFIHAGQLSGIRRS